MNLTERIIELARAGYAGVFVESHEERRVRHDLSAACGKEGTPLEEWRVVHWDTASGIVNGEQVATREEVGDILAFCDAALERVQPKSIVSASDLHLHLANPVPQTVQAVRALLAVFRASQRVLVGIGPSCQIPPELVHEFAVVKLDLPTVDRLEAIAREIATAAHLDAEGAPEAANAARGLTCIEAENAFSLSLVREHKLVAAVVQAEKEGAIKGGGLVEVVHTPTLLSDVGGLEVLKTWVRARRKAFGQSARDYGLPNPKGLLLVGVPGTGKSLAAKATAAELGLPLLKADAGRWYGSLVGESERNLRSVLDIAEAIAPCVLWIDEIEKGLSGSQSSGQTDGGTSSRVLGTLISWLQEKTAPVFVVATANNVASLPPETIRKGRFDELFFVDLPTAAERRDIWSIHITKKGRKPEDYDLAALAEATEGYTGAEIEQCWIEAMYLAFDADRERPSADDLTAAISSTVPLSKTAAEQVAACRKWADGRARHATAPEKVQQKPTGHSARKVSV